MSAFFCTKLPFFVQNGNFTQSNSVRAVLEIFFSSVFSFCKTKGYYYWKHNFCGLLVRNPTSGLLQIGQKSKKWQWRYNFPTWRQRQYFWRYFVSFVKFNYWSKFHVNIVNGSGIMTISFYKGWPDIRKSEIRPSEFFPKSGDWGKL